MKHIVHSLKTTTLSFVIAFLVGILPITANYSSYAAGSSTLYPSPASSSITPGQSQAVQIHFNNQTGAIVKALSFTLHFAPDKVEVLSTSPNSNTNNSAGTVVFYRYTLDPPTYGDTTELTVTFRGKNAGISSVTFSDICAKDYSSGLCLATGSTGGSITIANTATPPAAQPPSAPAPVSSPTQSPSPTTGTTSRTSSGGTSSSLSSGSAAANTNNAQTTTPETSTSHTADEFLLNDTADDFTSNNMSSETPTAHDSGFTTPAQRGFNAGLLITTIIVASAIGLFLALLFVKLKRRQALQSENTDIYDNWMPPVFNQSTTPQNPRAPYPVVEKPAEYHPTTQPLTQNTAKEEVPSDMYEAGEERERIDALLHKK